MIRSVLVVGGSGAVGEEICRDLASSGGYRITVAGRRLDAAKRVAAAIGGHARRIDLDAPETWPMALHGIDMVVVCMDQKDTAFVARLFERGIDYVDITAGDTFFRSLEALPPPSRSTGLLSVGLAPGLTNILAAVCAADLDMVEAIEIGLMFGTGDSHGAAGVAWVADTLFGPDRDRKSAEIDFGPPWGRRKAHAVGFSDQYALMRTLPVGRVTTRLCFDSRLMSALTFGLARRFAGSETIRKLATVASERVRVGSRVCNVAVNARGLRDGKAGTSHLTFLGEGESRTTARLAALAIRSLRELGPRPGVWHSHQLFQPRDWLLKVRAAGIGAMPAL